MDEVLKQHTITQNATVGVNHSLRVTLGSNFTTPYRWAPDMKIGDSTILKQTDHDFVRPTSGSMGAAGSEVWNFTALKAGTTTITTTYTSFVGKDSSPACTYTAIVTVQ
jgi:inhibitor of cysteine peptidase